VVVLADRSAFETEIGPLFEGAPTFLGRLAAERPFESPEALFERARTIAHAMPEAEQLELIDAHPRLGAPPGTVSAHSFREQGYDRKDDGAGPTAGTAETVDVATQLERLNDAYEAEFGFRYCVFVAGRQRAELLPGMSAALEADRSEEIHRALDAVVDIAADRYRTARTGTSGQAQAER
jgi:2-oxo-4-hydroxy-4-carboxy-5-ureidoimidazoline decarboxylase